MKMMLYKIIEMKLKFQREITRSKKKSEGIHRLESNIIKSIYYKVNNRWSRKDNQRKQSWKSNKKSSRWSRFKKNNAKTHIKKERQAQNKEHLNIKEWKDKVYRKTAIV